MISLIDIETDSLTDIKNVWCIVCKNPDTKETQTFIEPTSNPESLTAFLSYAEGVTLWVGHNIINYDLPVLSKTFPSFSWNPKGVIDTLVVARLLNYQIPGGNSLEAWGHRLKIEKGQHKEFSCFTPELLTYCIQDIEVTHALYETFKPYITSSQHKSSLRTEHDIASLANTLHSNGFSFDVERGSSLREELLRSVASSLGALRSLLPARYRAKREVSPTLTKSGTLNRKDFRWLTDTPTTGGVDRSGGHGHLDLRDFNGGPFSLLERVEFNPGSPKQCVERLWEAGWQPIDKTKGYIAAERAVSDRRRARQAGTTTDLDDRLEYYAYYGWKINETNLNTLPRDAPDGIKKLVEYLMLSSRASTLEEWLSCFNPETGRIHGRFNHIGAWTGRMSHNTPNTANIPGVVYDAQGSPLRGLPGRYGADMRELWQAAPGKLLVGVDADSIQLRVLAHCINDPLFTEALTKGRKEGGTDAHTMNMIALGRGNVCKSRDVAKTFIYAFLLGAGTAKIAAILECSNAEAKQAINNFLEYYPGLKKLRSQQIPADAARGYFVGLDGRIVLCSSEHLMLAGYLQNGEAIIMKRANLLWKEVLRTRNIDFKQVNFVHDEWQTEVNSLTDAETCGKIMVQSIVQAGLDLKLNCPLAGNAKVGKNWLETH